MPVHGEAKHWFSIELKQEWVTPEGEERLVNSGSFTGMPVVEGSKAITAHAAEHGFGGPETQVRAPVSRRGLANSPSLAEVVFI